MTQQNHITASLEALVAQRVNEAVGAQLSRIEIHARSHSGPIPSPEDLQKYAEVIPNGAERIMTMAERQQTHRMKLENFVITWQQIQSTLGQFFALGLSIALIASGIYLTLKGYSVVAGIIFSTTIAAVAGVFIYGRHLQKQDLNQKAQNN